MKLIDTHCRETFSAFAASGNVFVERGKFTPLVLPHLSDTSRSAADVHDAAVAREFLSCREGSPGREGLGVQSQIVRVALLGGHLGIDSRRFRDTRANRFRGS
jgi:hypothetical protein